MARAQSEIKPSISVIIPTYNRRKTLIKALEAYRKQSIPQEKFEILVIDDGSTDSTKRMIEKLQKEHKNIYFFQQSHSGPAQARNLGIEKASSELILFTGDDCVPDKNLLQEHIRLHKKGDAIAVLGHIDWHPDLEITPFMRYINIDTQFSYPKIKETPANVPFGCFYTSNISIPKKYFQGVGIFDTDFTDAVLEDVELGYRIWKSGVRTIYNKRAITYHHHKIALKNYIRRQMRLGKAAALLYNKHPELLEFLRLPKLTSPEVKYRFYQAVLDYYYFLGLQSNLEVRATEKQFISLSDRLKNWSDIERDRLMQKLLMVEQECRNSRNLVHKRDHEIQKLHKRLGREVRELHTRLHEETQKRDTEIQKRGTEIQKRDTEIQKRGTEIQKRETEIQKRDEEISKRDETIEELRNKNQEKYYRIVELEKFELKIKSSPVYKIYRFLRDTLAKG
jgi:glycosyltransferase involved in cell wall biosynthesis